MNRPLSRHEEERLAHLYSEKVEDYLDAGHGACYMNDNRVAKVVADAFLFFDGPRYQLAAWCVMPNHAHVVIQPIKPYELSDILHSWKSFAAKEANKILNRSGDFWQSESYDHLIRDAADFAHSVSYALENPAKAGLKNWKWVGRGTGVPPVKTTRKMRVPH
jgi:REP element-mobilizing transposase RayT